jgi:Peptidase family M48
MTGRTRRNSPVRRHPAYVAGFALLLWSAGPSASEEPKGSSHAAATTPRVDTPASRTTSDAAIVLANRLQVLVDDFRVRLSIPDAVVVSIISRNALVVSVERINDGRFALSVEDGFLNTLNDDELNAVVAHELGHVWIFTHHPYLQTEESANRIALRLVSRDSLERVYDKVWTRAGTRGHLAYFPVE